MDTRIIVIINSMKELVYAKIPYGKYSKEFEEESV